MGPSRGDQDLGRGRPGQPVREARLRDHPAGHQAWAARHRHQTAGVLRFRLAGQPTVAQSGEDRPQGVAAAAEGRRLGGHRLCPVWPSGQRLPTGVPPPQRPDRPVLRPGPSAPDSGQARPGSPCPGQRETPPRHAFAQTLAGDPAAGGRHTGRADRRHPRSPVRQVDRRLSEIVPGSAGQVRAGPGPARSAGPASR